MRRGVGEREKGREGERERGSAEKEISRSPAPPLALSVTNVKRPAAAVVLLLCLVLAGVLPGCGYYSFTGATIPTHLNTVAIPLAQDNTVSPLTTMDDILTQLLIDRMVGQTRLSLEPTETEADAVLSAIISQYRNEPTSVSGEEVAQLNRVTITVSARYLDRVEDEEILQRSFSSFAEYDPLAQGVEGEEQAAQTALQNIADDIFTAATSNW